MKVIGNNNLRSVLIAMLVMLMPSTVVLASGMVIVKTLVNGAGPEVTKSHKYRSMVTLYIENDDGSKTPSGWSTRKEDGAAADNPFSFQPGQNLIEGWTNGVLKMKEGERAMLHVPSGLGYGGRPMGSQGAGGFYIPADSNLLFDIEILGKVGGPDAGNIDKEM